MNRMTLFDNLMDCKIELKQEEEEKDDLLRSYLDKGLDLYSYADDHSCKQLEVLADTLEYGVGVEGMTDPRLDVPQLKELHKKKILGYDISKIANPDYDFKTIRYLGYFLEDGFDVSLITDKKFNSEQVYQLYLGFKHGLDITQLLDENYSPKQMEILRECLLNGIDLEPLVSHNLDQKQMLEVYEGLKVGINLLEHGCSEDTIWRDMLSKRMELSGTTI